MQLIKTTSSVLAAILIIATLQTGVAHGQQLTDAVSNLIGGLRGSLNSLLGGGRNGYNQPPMPQDLANQLMSLPASLLQQLQNFPQGGGYQQQMGPMGPMGQMGQPPMWPPMGPPPGWQGPPGQRGGQQPMWPMGPPPPPPPHGWHGQPPNQQQPPQMWGQFPPQQPSADNQSDTSNEIPSYQNLNQFNQNQPQYRQQQQQQQPDNQQQPGNPTNQQETSPVTEAQNSA